MGRRPIFDERLQTPHEEYEEIVAAVTAHDGKRASAIMRHHVAIAKRLIKENT